MTECPHCRAALPGESRFCPSCGNPVFDGTPDATIAYPREPESSRASRPPSSFADSTDGALFPAGTILDERYRVIGALGRGGMGEVLRADDLKLGQSVALKLLPENLRASPTRLELFYNEVSVARQVAHPNVARVYDVGEIEGRTFLSMEFIDGEDLSSLLRRIGRLPHEKAVEIARQLCAGLAALHDRGVVHRDLKPANVMIDGRGRVRITDFGLAAFARDLTDEHARAGTPAYMAPEQLSGERATERSDLYSLGLVLYEVFSGRQAFEADTLAEITRLQRESTPANVSTIITEVDPTVDRVIERCLEKDPTRRPPSALSVAAALPGGDPLAAALAAGETPSPEMVAASGKRGGVRPVVALACVGAVLVGVFLKAGFLAGNELYGRVPLEKPPEVLEHRAREMLTAFGYETAPRDRAHGFDRDDDVISHVRQNDDTPQRWDRLADGRPAGLVFWYRESPELLVPRGAVGVVTLTNPPLDTSDMVSVRLDTEGRLLQFQAVPPPEDDSTAAPPGAVDWGPLFEAAELDPELFTASEPRWTPPFFADERAAWVGAWSAESEEEIRVEAAAYRGKPVAFDVVGPWSQPNRAGESESVINAGGQVAILLLFVGVVVGGVILAHRNVRLGRGDRRGALRLSIFVFVIGMIEWLFSASHVSNVDAEIQMLFITTGLILLIAGLFVAFYLALEPYMRRIWPERIVSWSRLLAGQVRDPLIGRDILIGGVMFAAFALFEAGEAQVRVWNGDPLPNLGHFGTFALVGVRYTVAQAVSVVLNSAFNAIFFVVLLLLLRAIFRKLWIAVTLFMAFFVTAEMVGGASLSAFLDGFLFSGLTVFVLARFGLLPYMVGFFYNQMLGNFPLTLDFSSWYAGTSLFVIALVVGLAIFGMVTATSGRSLFHDELET